MKKLILAVAISTLLVGCANTGISKQNQGAIAGTAIGVLLGSNIGKGKGNTAAMVIGGMVGAMVGSEIGRQLDERDRYLMATTTHKALEYQPSGNSVGWKNPDSGHSGEITPVKTYETSKGYCREFYNDVYINGKKQRAYGTACRKPDGSWEMQ